MLDVSRLGKRFAGLRALSEVSFGVPAGRIVGLIGPNGAGKTTLVNCLTMAQRPTTGTVSWSGVRLTGLSPERVARAGVSRTFQHARLFADRTVLDNVLAGTHLSGRAGMLAATLRLPAARRDERRSHRIALAALESVHCAELAGVPAASLTTGHQRLIAVARALATRPGLLLLDEPAAGLNDAETRRLAGDLRAIATRDGLTLLVIEHHLSFVMELCDEVIVLAGGRLIAHGTPAQVRRDPAVIAAYLGREE